MGGLEERHRASRPNEGSIEPGPAPVAAAIDDDHLALLGAHVLDLQPRVPAIAVAEEQWGVGRRATAQGTLVARPTAAIVNLVDHRDNPGPGRRLHHG